MTHTEIYYKDWCPWSRRALRLLDERGIAYTAYDITQGAAAKEQEMQRRSGRTSVPQIFINGLHVGGHDDLVTLDANGGLEPMAFSRDLACTF